MRNAIQLEHCMTTSYILQVTRELAYSGWRKHLCQNLFFNEVAGACNFIKKETLAQVSSSEFCEISKTPFLTEHLRWLLLFDIDFINYTVDININIRCSSVILWLFPVDTGRQRTSYVRSIYVLCLWGCRCRTFMMNQILRFILYFDSNNDSICAFQNSLIFMQTENLGRSGNWCQVDALE